MAAKQHDQGLYENLLQKITAAKPDLTVVPTTQAFLHHEIDAVFGAAEADRLNAVPDSGAVFDGEIRIAGLMAVRNEGGRVSAGVEAMLGYCNFVLILDHRSTDGAPEDAQEKFEGIASRSSLCPTWRRSMNSKPGIACLSAHANARRHAFCRSDADEILGPALANREVLYAEARKLQPGESLAAPVADIFGDGFMDYTQFSGLNDLSRLLPLHRDLLYCDDGKGAVPPDAFT